MSESFELMARAYQNELFERAKATNAILHAPTGTGKTLIASMTIKWALMDYSMHGNGDRKVAVFLVPSVPLVDQQVKFLKDTTALTVDGYVGARGVDTWDRAMWQKEFNHNDILVMTPQIFQNLLLHSHWRLQNVAIIVFDEVHHCAKKHPYAQIMRDHYHPLCLEKEADLPRLLGLTASPLRNAKNPRHAINTLQDLSKCTVFDVLRSKDELEQHAFRASKQLVYYPFMRGIHPQQYPDYPSTLYDHLREGELLPSYFLAYEGEGQDGDKWQKNLDNRFEATYQELGPLGAEMFLHSHLKSTIEKIQEKLPSEAFITGVDKHANLRHYLRRVQHVLAEHHSRIARDGPRIPRHWISPKLERLVSLLEKEDVEDWRGIVFVSQRQVAASIPILLHRLGITKIVAEPLVGHSSSSVSNSASMGASGMTITLQDRIVDEFRLGKVNLLVATSVGQEGLDFPECSFVCMFDPPTNVSGMVQSRGRARHATSKFIIMTRDHDPEEKHKINELFKEERILQDVYQRSSEQYDKRREGAEGWDDDEDDVLPNLGDLEKVQVYQVPETGAKVTWGSAVALLNNFCALIPHDPDAPALAPQFKEGPGRFSCVVRLPAALPIPRDYLAHKGLLCSTKKNAKRSAAFEAVKALHKLGSLDRYLLPLRKARAEKPVEDIDGKPPVETAHIGPMIDAPVLDLWGDVRGNDKSQIWIHPIHLDYTCNMALVHAGSFRLPTVSVWERDEQATFGFGKPIKASWSHEERKSKVKLMEDFTRWGLSVAVTRRCSKGSRVFLVPFDAGSNLLDFSEMDRMMINTRKRTDWMTPPETINGPNHILVELPGRNSPCRLEGIKVDASVQKCIEDDERLQKALEFLRSRQPDFTIPEHDVVIQCRKVIQATSVRYRQGTGSKNGPFAEEIQLWPRSFCSWYPVPAAVFELFQFLPRLTRVLNDTYRASQLERLLGLPPLRPELGIECITLPSTSMGFSNQRLETLGDGFLKIATTIHAFNIHLTKHEGQLTVLRQTSVSNRYLMGRGHVLRLTRFMTGEPNNHRTWRLHHEDVQVENDQLHVIRSIPRRSIQDCMEAILGAAYLSGGIRGGLIAGRALDLCFGGEELWTGRYPQPTGSISATPPNLAGLEEALGYTFRNKNILVEAVTHPTYTAAGPSYQRLEFLGDAVLDFIILERIFHKFPNATPHQLTLTKSRLTCNPTLAAFGVKKLGIHKRILIEYLTIQQGIMSAAHVLQAMTYEDILQSLWRLDPPKAINDVVEGLIGGIFVDSDYNFELLRDIVLNLFHEFVEELVHPGLPDDPIPQLMIWTQKHRCDQVKFRKDSSSEEVAPRKDLMFVNVHGVDIGKPAEIRPKEALTVSRALSCYQALPILQEPSSRLSLANLCNCEEVRARARITATEQEANSEQKAELLPEEKEHDLDTVEGFGEMAKVEIERASSVVSLSVDGDDSADEVEVEEMLLHDSNDEMEDIAMVL